MIATGTRKMVMGTIIKQPVYYNSPWSYHLDPKSIGFGEFAVELCDANMSYLEANLDIAYSDWCPWTSRLVKEIPPPQKPVTENLVPTVSMRFPYADTPTRAFLRSVLRWLQTRMILTARSLKLDSTAAT